MRATCPAHIILVDLITQVMFGEEQAYKLYSFITIITTIVFHHDS
jgi:hypothetical protein